MPTEKQLPYLLRSYLKKKDINFQTSCPYTKRGKKHNAVVKRQNLGIAMVLFTM